VARRRDLRTVWEKGRKGRMKISVTPTGKPYGRGAGGLREVEMPTGERGEKKKFRGNCGGQDRFGARGGWEEKEGDPGGGERAGKLLTN